jgi:diguanylate cyclase (GGDEF)-like protein
MKIRILIADDEPDIRDILKILLTKEDFEVIETCDGQEALEQIHKKNPDMIILDRSMPKMNGRDLCQLIKKDLLLRHVPIILLTGKGDIDDKVSGLQAGADDYIVKPFEPKELIARIKMVIRRMQCDLEANPLTRLPGNISIMTELKNRIDNKKPFAVCYLDLDKFKSYNDKYGFEHGDEVIKQTARIIIKAVDEKGNPDDFVGHIGGDDYVAVTTTDKMIAVCEAVIKEFESYAPNFYNEEDKKNGYIMAKDRQGVMQKIPLISISIGVVTNEYHNITHVAQIGEIGAELKSAAKKLERSNYIIDQRRDTP